MELVKNIFFNTDKLIQGETVKISYTGNLFQANADKVFIHFGFGQNWNGLSEIEMTKTDLGLQTEITLSDTYETFNFCFRDNYGNWDNNGGVNYIFNIEPANTTTLEEELGLVTVKQRKLRKTYLWSKKVRIALYKIITFIPKIISGNYKRKVKED